MKRPIDQAVKRAIAGLFYPLEFAPATSFSVPMLAIATLILVATGLFALPPLREVMRHAFAIHCLDEDARTLGKQYSDFAQIMFQVFIAVVIGGLIVTARIATAVRDAMQRYELAGATRLEVLQRRMTANMYRSYVYVKRRLVGLTLWNFPFRIFSAFSIMNRTFGRVVLLRVPTYYGAILAFRALTGFPEGLYGVAAFVLFESMIASKVAKSYFDYFPAC